MKRLFVIGDIHGCREELEKLLEMTDRYITAEDEYVFLGDYIDRGPDSKGVIDVLIARSKTHPNAHVFLTGNHEEMMVKGESYWALNGGLETLSSYGLIPEKAYEFNNYWEEIPADHREFLKDLKLYYRAGRVVCVHAGLQPGISLLQQNKNAMVWDRTYVGYDGDYHDDVMVVYGHTPSYSITERKNQRGIDTACVFGGKLTCVVMETVSGEHVNTFSIKSGFNW
jgi:serine/threonine protein phosphatase 1